MYCKQELSMIASPNRSHHYSRSVSVQFRSYVAGCIVVTALTLLLSAKVIRDSSPGLRRSRDSFAWGETLDNEETTIAPTFLSKSLDAPRCLPIGESDIDFTLVTQLSPDRLWLMEEHCKRWGDHPISIAIGGNVPRSGIAKALRGLGCNTEKVELEVVSVEEGEDYPVNELRNKAMANIKTSHAVFIDADFLLSTNVYEKLQEQRAFLATDTRIAMVIPAFELRSFCSDLSTCHKTLVSSIPETKEDLVDIIHEDPSNVLVAQFDSKGNVAGHGSTKYGDWIEQDEHSQVLKIDCLTSPRYEPYMVIRYCQDMPPFQNVFKGYGMNKLTWIQHLRHVGYTFYQVGHSFAMHFPHRKSSSWRKWNKERRGEERLATKADMLAKTFYNWLQSSVPSHAVVPYCNDTAQTLHSSTE